jgi:trk system potassium uptake protein TrkA
MKIIILGAGQVGSSVARNLASEANDITVVDQDAELLRKLGDSVDLRTVRGYAAHPEVLERAGAEDADMVLAVTNNDETNMVACQVSWTLFHTPTKIARVRALAFTRHPELFGREALPVDVLISPEQLVTEYVTKIIEVPGTLQVLDFADGRVRLVAVKAVKGGPLVGHELKTLYDHLPHAECRVAAIYRDGEAIQPKGYTVIEEGDEVFFVAARDQIVNVMSELRKLEEPYRNIMICGGGNIGRRLAGMLQGRYRVKLIEHHPQRAIKLAEELENVIVLEGSGADESLLDEENIDTVDVFCAVTNDEEANILSAMLAKRMGARKVLALINRASYVDLVESGPIDVAISPQQATIGSLLTHVRKGDVVMVHSLRRGAAEAIEAVAHGDHRSSKVVNKTIEQIRLPKGASIAAIVRGDEVLIAHHDTRVLSGDHVIMFLVDKRRIREIERLFQVSVTFL